MNTAAAPVSTEASTPAPGSTAPAIALTPAAADSIRSLLGADIASKGLRLFVEAGGCSGMSYGMELSARREGDAEFPQHGVRLFADEMAVTYLTGSVIDFKDGLSGAGFRISNPNAKQTCGCGKSFEA